jgi:hypothetical protein
MNSASRGCGERHADGIGSCSRELTPLSFVSVIIPEEIQERLPTILGRPLNRQAISREVRRDSSGLGHSAVTAAVIAATSASLAVGRTAIT